MPVDLFQSFSVVILMILTLIPLCLSILLVVLVLQTQRTVAIIRATQERKAAEEAIRLLAAQSESERAAMEARIVDRITEQQQRNHG